MDTDRDRDRVRVRESVDETGILGVGTKRGGSLEPRGHGSGTHELRPRSELVGF